MQSIEGLNQIIQVEPGLGGDLPGGPVASESRVQREMGQNGMETGHSSSVAAPGKGFMDVLSDSVAKVNMDQVEADSAIRELVAGRTKNIHETMLAVERADASLKLMMQVRNKVLDAYREIMRMQV